ncbi:MAG: hypothetical protein ACK5QJ_01395 [Microcystis sp.]|jgi:hypothetical protein|uniref:hypothetical protein n=1 Tax=Microcystis sp. TaxID=1127 RepID=UPI0022C39D78|nr:hypothetical protein [Microcystis sp. LE17-20D]MCZ8065259.1 hypothetical protein [Microcystis sp. LE17-20D]MCZ8162256.1 hypothetical protein [Microcystis sp. LE19-196.1B]MCZ8275115.1 hypothetical protein [Microcystis sp. LE19-4.1E]
MNTYKIQTVLTEDGTVLLKELPFQAGDAVEIIILEQSKTSLSSSQEKLIHSLKGSVLRYDDPFEPAIPPEDWEILK